MHRPIHSLNWRRAATLLTATLGVAFLPAAAASGGVYVVKRNDCLSVIAQAHGIGARELAKANGLSLQSTIYAGQRLRLPAPGPTEARTAPRTASPRREPPARTVYVQKNDSLALIALRHGVTVAALARVNGLSLRDTIHPGQKLRLPGGGRLPPQLAADVHRAIYVTPVRRGAWQHLVIHHSGTTTATLPGMDAYHRVEREMENGLAYHFVIGNGQGIGDGEVVVGNRWAKQLEGGHLASRAQNLVTLGICLVGHFDQHRPTRKQLDSLEALLRALTKRCGLSTSAIKTHQQINKLHTRCPGRLFDLEAVLARLRTS